LFVTLGTNVNRYKCRVKNGQKCAVKIPHFDL